MMMKLPISLLCFLMVIVMPMVFGIALGPKAVEEWFEKVSHKKEVVTKLHFYFHDTVSGKNPTAMRVAQANITDTSPTIFGAVNMMDDQLTEGPEPTSKTIGRAQGLYGSAGLSELGLLMTLNFYFTDGEYNGSTLAVLGRYPALDLYREISIVGGSGIFRLARGTATARTNWINFTTGDAIVEYNVVVLHY